MIPIGVTKEKVTGLLSYVVERSKIEGIVALTLPGFEEVKRDILSTLRGSADLLRARFEEVSIGLGDAEASAKIYRALKKIGSKEVYVSLITGSRYFIPIIMQALLRYSRDEGAMVYAIYGLEGVPPEVLEKRGLQGAAGAGGEYEVVPLLGFLVDGLVREQKKIFRLIYEQDKDELRTKEDLIEKYGFSRSVYKALDGLEKKGLIEHRRDRIIKTFPGKLLYNLLREAGEI